MRFPKKLIQKISSRKEDTSLRSLGTGTHLIDFSSNDYLGYAKSGLIFDKTHQFLIDKNIKQNGATGSRLLSGNHKLYISVEKKITEFHNTEAALIFNSGYDANIGFFSSVPQRGDIILYDEFIHASIRDGVQLSNAKSYKFKHNDIGNLENKILSVRTGSKNQESEIYVITESVFSMDGDSPDLIAIVETCKKHNVYLIVDEAHAVGVFKNGLVEKVNLENDVFARIITFGKALGCHGAVILGSGELKQYLINFARSFIYTTGLPPHSLATVHCVYEELESSNGIENSKVLHQNIQHFISETKRLNLKFINSDSAIHCCIIPSNEKVKYVAKQLKEKGFEVKPILSPTVTKGEERLRFCLHAYNSRLEITNVLEHLAIFV